MRIEPIALAPVDGVTITTLVDNVTDALLADDGPVKRAPFALVTKGEVLRAEHGFSALVTITKGSRVTRVLFDSGITPDGLIENMRRLELSPKD
jgi:7,8-dihydropterin-6-yl-methyl-4-(beta-D-ribofuranosyl)aminobenzene 5'-phosphate synthase